MSNQEAKLKEATKQNVRNWREKKGNEIFKKRYKLLREAGYSSYMANYLKYKSDAKIEKLIDERKEAND